MPPKAAAATSSVKPTRVSSRAKAGSGPTGKRKADDEAANEPPPKKRTTTSKVTAATKSPSAAKLSKRKTTVKPAKAETKPVAASKSSKTKPPVTTSQATTKKRKNDEVDKAPSKRVASRSVAAKKSDQPKPLPVINSVPSEKLDVFVMGEGESGELGLGTTRRDMGVKRPRLHPMLSSGNVDIVHMALGGMHAAALTRNNEILTWGVNDNGACGRDTTWEGGMKDADAESDDDSDSEADTGLNPKEATPTAIPSEDFPKGTKFVQLAAGDSCTFALTAEGLVYGWGTFRDNNGVLGFRADVHIAKKPMLIPEVKQITQIACGNNHAIALDLNGNVWVWGAGEQNQLGRRIVERTRLSCLKPRELGVPRKQIKYISSGGEFSFAIAKNDKVYAWGLNNYDQTGIPDNDSGAEVPVVAAPKIVKQLSNYKLTSIKGGNHHSVAVTDSGACLVWGRAGDGQAGIATDSLPEEDVIKNHGRVGILKKPTPVPGITCKFATTASDHSIALTTDGQAYSWGFNGCWQTGQGAVDDVKIATLIDNNAVRGRNLNWAGAGGQYSALTSLAGPLKSVTVNGTSAAAPQTEVAASQPKAAAATALNGPAALKGDNISLPNEIAPAAATHAAVEQPHESQDDMPNGV